MILVGNSRANGQDLARHLMSPDNERVDVHSIEGFASDDLHGAFKEAEAVSRGTRCKKYLFSLSLSPPPDETVETSIFEDAIDRAESKLGLSGMPKATVFHEKYGDDGNLRRHAHVVWSRIDTEEMKAVPMDYSRRKLFDLAKELYLENEWDMPKGFISPTLRDDQNLTLPEWQQAKRLGQDPREMKAIFRQAWTQSDSKAALENALAEHGLAIARGDKRGFVATDMHGKVYPLARWSGVKTKDVRERIGDAKELRSLTDAKEHLAERLGSIVTRLQTQEQEKLAEKQQAQELARQEEQQKAEAQRELQRQWQQQREAIEAQRRQERFNTGARGFIDRLTGERQRMDDENRLEAYRAAQRDREQRDQLISQQQEQQARLDAMRAEQMTRQQQAMDALRQDQMRLDGLRSRENQTPKGMDGPER